MSNHFDDVTDEEIDQAANELDNEEADQAAVRVEMEHGKALLALEEAHKAKLDEINKNRPEMAMADDDAYGVKMWNGHAIFQCHYCALDVPDFDEARMKEHVRLAHPHPRGPHLYDDYGNWIGD